jgi:GDP-mannose 6-dehydrogenase
MNESPITVSVFGLGYVGCVSAACLASRGHRVIGVDVNPDKVASLREGRSPIVEERIAELTAEVVRSTAHRHLPGLCRHAVGARWRLVDGVP